MNRSLTHPWPVGPAPGEEVAVLLPGEVGQLVKGHEVIRLALVFEPVLGVLHGPEDDFGPAGEGPGVGAGVVPGPGERHGVVVQGFIYQLGKLGEGLTENEGLVVWDMDLPQGLDDKGIALSAPRSSSVQGLPLRPLHESGLPGLGLPYHIHGCSTSSPSGGTGSWSTGASSTTPPPLASSSFFSGLYSHRSGLRLASQNICAWALAGTWVSS